MNREEDQVPLKVTFELSDKDLRHFKRVMREAREKAEQVRLAALEAEDSRLRQEEERRLAEVKRKEELLDERKRVCLTSKIYIQQYSPPPMISRLKTCT